MQGHAAAHIMMQHQDRCCLEGSAGSPLSLSFAQDLTYFVVIHKVKELGGANLLMKILICGHLDDGVQMRFLLLLPLLLLVCLLGLC